MAGVLAQHEADLSDQAEQARLGDERLGPEPRLKVGFRDRPRPVLHEQQQQLERLRRDVDLGTLLEQLPCIEIEGELPEAEAVPRCHGRPLYRAARLVQFSQAGVGSAHLPVRVPPKAAQVLMLEAAGARHLQGGSQTTRSVQWLRLRPSPGRTISTKPSRTRNS